MQAEGPVEVRLRSHQQGFEPTNADGIAVFLRGPHLHLIIPAGQISGNHEDLMRGHVVDDRLHTSRPRQLAGGGQAAKKA